ncbi:MAG: wax ester/triacylglycerol synthase family O-acyltransferase [Burkholderiaceae bacterium]|nr:wax ester/triacylglycerol synthase family O-acyltransferase [Burkholderiaceae bacterium]
MSAVDAAWYQMDGPANHAMITGILLTRTPLDFDQVRTLYRERLLVFERFRQRVVERGLPLRRPHWEDVADFDIDQHLHHVALPAPGDSSALRTLIEDVASTPLDHRQPLWQVHVVDGVGGGSALIMRLHHCVGDGAAMMSVMQKLFDPAPGRRAARAPANGAPAARAKAVQSLGSALATIERAARRTLGPAGGIVVDALVHPGELLRKAALVLGGAGVLLGELVKWPDPKGPLKGEFGLRKRVAWSDPVSIRDVKAIGAPSDAKVNDVLVAAMAGALREYLRHRGIDVARTTVRAMVPVDLRPPERFGQLGNEFGLVILELPVSKGRWSDRLAATKARMDALKRSPEAIAMLALFHIFGRTPKAVEDLANQVFGSKASLVMTNVAGPREPLSIAGATIDRLVFWVPHPGRQLGMGISIFSYNGQATLAVVADAHLVPDPERITEAFNREFEQMLARTRARAEKAAGTEAAGKKAAAKKAAPKKAAPKEALAKPGAANAAPAKPAPAGAAATRRAARAPVARKRAARARS